MVVALVEKEFGGKVVSFNDAGWFNATDVAAQFDKRPVDWLSLDSTKEYIAILCDVNRSEKSSLLKVRRGGRGKPDATWMHPKLAVAFARWLDMKFSIWCDSEIDSILRGKSDWHKLRHGAASSFKVMNEALKIFREEQGKVSESHHYSNESRMINWVISGKFCSLDRETLSAKELDLMAHLEVKNSVLISRGVDYDMRKKILEQYAIDLRDHSLIAA